VARGNDVVDQDAARELQLFVENDGDLHRRQGQPILKNLATKMARGIYKHEGAVKLYGYLMKSGAEKYAKEFGPTTFGPATRRAAAEQFALGFEAEWNAGQYRDLLPKKYRIRVTNVDRFKQASLRAYVPSAIENYRGHRLVPHAGTTGRERVRIYDARGKDVATVDDMGAAKRTVDAMLGD